MNHLDFDTDGRADGSHAAGRSVGNGTTIIAAAHLEPERIRTALQPETVALARAAQDADPALVPANGITLRSMALGERPQSLMYGFHLSAFGPVLIASGAGGVSHVDFVETKYRALRELSETFPRTPLQEGEDPLHAKVVDLINGAGSQGPRIVLNLPGTTFQHRVWTALLHIPRKMLVTYGQIAQFIGQPHSARAVGTAIGANTAAFLIPCHRVVRRSGEIGGFRWGVERKTAMILAEIEGNEA